MIATKNHDIDFALFLRWYDPDQVRGSNTSSQPEGSP